jgi:small-conductance mechanosensitive channel
MDPTVTTAASGAVGVLQAAVGALGVLGAGPSRWWSGPLQTSTAGSTPTPGAGPSGLGGSLPRSVGGWLALVPPRYWAALGVLLAGIVVYVLVRRGATRLLDRIGLGEAIEGTAFERTAREFGTSTVGLLSGLLGYFVFGVAVITALTVARVNFADPFWSAVATSLPGVFLAVIVVIVGVVVGDKLDVVVSERLRGVKLPQTGIIPSLVKYSVVYVAILIALSQVGVATLALVVLLAAYLFAVILFAAIASYSLLASSAAGAYLLLNQPYGIGDEVRVGDVSGIVQEIDLFVTHIETDEEEHIVPNRRVFEEGVVRVRS